MIAFHIIAAITQSSSIAGPFKAYVLEGQSNAEGAPEIAGLPGDLSGAQTGRYIYTPLTGDWDVLQAGVNNRSLDTLPNFGVEMRLMQLLQDHYSEDIYLAKYAAPGTQLAQGGGVTD